jgi:hypothetical protein
LDINSIPLEIWCLIGLGVGLAITFAVLAYAFTK